MFLVHLRCDCRPQLEKAFDQIINSDGGAIVYMSGHEGRGIGLWAKAVTYLLQDEGQNTYQANRSLGLLMIPEILQMQLLF